MKKKEKKTQGYVSISDLNKMTLRRYPDQLLYLFNSPSNLHISLYFNYHIHQETLKLNYSMNSCYILGKFTILFPIEKWIKEIKILKENAYLGSILNKGVLLGLNLVSDGRSR